MSDKNFKLGAEASYKITELLDSAADQTSWDDSYQLGLLVEFLGTITVEDNTILTEFETFLDKAIDEDLEFVDEESEADDDDKEEANY